MPLSDLRTFGIEETTWYQHDFSQEEQQKFTALLHYEIAKVTLRQKRAEEGLRYIPGRSRFAVSLAAFTYFDTLLHIQKDLLSVFSKKHASTRRQIFHIFLRSLLTFYRTNKL